MHYSQSGKHDRESLVVETSVLTTVIHSQQISNDIIPLTVVAVAVLKASVL